MIIGLFLMAFAFIFIKMPVENGEVGRNQEAGAWAYISLLAMIFFCCAFALGLGNVVSLFDLVFGTRPNICVVSLG
jgi:SP family myo-inositol transporter-like MFS transporter 13